MLKVVVAAEDFITDFKPQPGIAAEGGEDWRVEGAVNKSLLLCMGGEAVDARYFLFGIPVPDEGDAADCSLCILTFLIRSPSTTWKFFPNLIAGRDGETIFLIAVVGLILFPALGLKAEEPRGTIGEIVGEDIEFSLLSGTLC